MPIIETMEQKMRRVRREFSEEFKADIVVRCQVGDRSMQQVAKDFDLTPSGAKMLQNVERRFRVMKDFLGLRPVHHRAEERVRAHIALCVMAAVIEAVIAQDLARADARDPDLGGQVMSARRALAELAAIRLHRLDAGRPIELVDRPTPLQRAIDEALFVDTSAWPGTGSQSPDQGVLKRCRGNVFPPRPSYQGLRATPGDVGSELDGRGSRHAHVNKRSRRRGGGYSGVVANP